MGNPKHWTQHPQAAAPCINSVNIWYFSWISLSVWFRYSKSANPSVKISYNYPFSIRQYSWFVHSFVLTKVNVKNKVLKVYARTSFNILVRISSKKNAFSQSIHTKGFRLKNRKIFTFTEDVISRVWWSKSGTPVMTEQLVNWGKMVRSPYWALENWYLRLQSQLLKGRRAGLL